MHKLGPRGSHALRARVARVAAVAFLVAGGSVLAASRTGAVQQPASCPATTIAITNGGFELPVQANNTYTLRPEAIVPGWKTTATDHLIEIWRNPFGGVNAAEGVQHAELNANQVAALYQDIPTVPGTLVTYQVSHRGRGGVDTAQLQFGPPAGPANLTRSMVDGNTKWGLYTGTYTIPAGQTTTRFAFASISAAGGNPAVGNFIDNVQFGTPPCVVTSKTVTNLAGTSPAHPGDQLEYGITVANGGGNNAGALVVADAIPPGTAYLPGSLQVVSGPNAGAKSDAAGDDHAEYDPVGQRVKIRVGTGANAAAGGALATATSSTMRFRVTVLPSAAGTTVTNAAVTSWSDPADPTVTLTSTSNDVTMPVTSPSIAVVKSFTGNADGDHDGQISVGDALSYSLSARNSGSERLISVTMADPRLTGLTCGPLTSLGNPFLNGSSGLDPDEQVACTGTLTVAQADVDLGLVLNTASASGTGTAGTIVNDSDSVSLATAASAPSLSVAKSASPAAGAQVGDTITYTVVATNNGNVTLHGVTVTDPTLGPLVCTPVAPGTLLPGHVMVCSATKTVTQADVNVGSIPNTAAAHGLAPNGTPVDSTDSIVTPTVPRVGLLTVSKSMSQHDDLDANGSVSTGDVLHYTVTVTNAGTVTQTAVTVVDPVVAGLTCVPVQPTTLAPGASIICTGTHLVTQGDVNAGKVVNTATATGTPPPGVTNPPATVTVDTPTEAAVARLDVAKTPHLDTDADASATFTPGDTVGYTIATTNTGNVTLTGVTVTDPLLPGLVCTPVVPATLPPGGLITCSGTYVLTAADGTNGTRANTATATGTPPSGTPVQATGAAVVPVTTPLPAILVTKSLLAHSDADGSGSINPGDVLTYQITVTNAGNVLLTGIDVTDSRSPLTCSVPLPATLAPGAAFTCTGVVVVTQADQDAGELPNTAAATGTSLQGIPVADTDDTVVATEGRAPNATFTKVVTGITDTNGNGQADVGEVIGYALTLTNTGNVSLGAASISDDRIAALVCTPTQPATLAPGAALVCTGTLAVTQADQDAGAIVNHGAGTAVSPIGPITRTDDAVVLPAPAQPSLATTKVALVNDTNGSGHASVGETITYTLTVTNTGNVTLFGVAVTDPLVSVLTCTPTMPATLAPGDALVCSGDYTVLQADVDRGRVDNAAIGSGKDSAGRNVTGVDVASVATDAPAPALDVVKTAPSFIDPDGSGTITAGDTIRFSIVTTNTGNITIADVVVTDPSVPSLVCVPVLPATFVPGDFVTCTAEVVVTQADVDAGAVANTATAVGVSQDPSATPVTDTGTVSVPTAPAAPALSLVKTAGPLVDLDSSGSLSAGDLVSFTIVATNTGNVTLHSVSVSDPMLASMSCTPTLPADLAPGASATCEGSHVVTALEDADGLVTNIAIADVADTYGPFAAKVASAQVRREPVTSPTTELPRSGREISRLALVGLLCVLVGAGLLLFRRRSPV